MKISALFLLVLSSVSIAATDHGSTITTPQNSQRASPGAPLKPYPRLLPLQLSAPATAQAGVPLSAISVTLQNPGDKAPDARLRLIIHESDHGHGAAHLALRPDNIKVEVLHGGTWVPVLLGIVADGVIGAIGTEGVTAHRERHGRGGFAIPAGLNKTWQLRVTFSLPGTYSLVAAVSPDNGSTHLAQPAHSIIVVQ